MSRKINTLCCKLNLIIRNSSFQSLKVPLKTNDQIFIPFLLPTLPTTDKICICLSYNILFFLTSLLAQMVKASACNVGELGLILFLNFILTFFFLIVY